MNDSSTFIDQQMVECEIKGYCEEDWHVFNFRLLDDKNR